MGERETENNEKWKKIGIHKQNPQMMIVDFCFATDLWMTN